MYRSIGGLIFGLMIGMWIYVYIKTNSQIGGLSP